MPVQYTGEWVAARAQSSSALVATAAVGTGCHGLLLPGAPATVASPLFPRLETGVSRVQPISSSVTPTSARSARSVRGRGVRHAHVGRLVGTGTICGAASDSRPVLRPQRRCPPCPDAPWCGDSAAPTSAAGDQQVLLCARQLLHGILTRQRLPHRLECFLINQAHRPPAGRGRDAAGAGGDARGRLAA